MATPIVGHCSLKLRFLDLSKAGLLSARRCGPTWCTCCCYSERERFCILPFTLARREPSGRPFPPSRLRLLIPYMLDETFFSAWLPSFVSMASSSIRDSILRYWPQILMRDSWKSLRELNGCAHRRA